MANKYYYYQEYVCYYYNYNIIHCFNTLEEFHTFIKYLMQTCFLPITQHFLVK